MNEKNGFKYRLAREALPCNDCQFFLVQSKAMPCSDCAGWNTESNRIYFAALKPKEPEQQPETKICPLLMIGQFIQTKNYAQEEADCWGKRCAWWDEDSNPEYSQCAVLKINWNLVAAHGGRVPSKKGSDTRETKAQL